MAEVVRNDDGDAMTWSFFKLGTIKGSVTLRWCSPYSYYSDDVDLFWTKMSSP